MKTLFEKMRASRIKLARMAEARLHHQHVEKTRVDGFKAQRRVMMRTPPFWEVPEVKNACIDHQTVQDSTRLK